MRLPIAPDEKPVVILRCFATGKSYESLQYQFRKNISKCQELKKNGNP